MKVILAALVTLVSFNASAIEFITENQVADTLGADKVIEVSKYAVASLLLGNEACDQASASKSARAYIVKIEKKAHIVITKSGLSDLTICGEL